MKKNNKVILYIALALLATGAIIYIVSVNMAKKDYVADGSIKSKGIKADEPTIITIEKDPEVDKRKEVRNNFHKYITAQTDGYNVNGLGGITNLKIKVRNTSAYRVDMVELQIQYIKAGGGIFKTETVYAQDIKPNSSVVINGPDSNRGKEVRVNIAAVTSRVLGLCYVSGKRGADVEDPYLCN